MSAGRIARRSANNDAITCGGVDACALADADQTVAGSTGIGTHGDGAFPTR